LAHSNAVCGQIRKYLEQFRINRLRIYAAGRKTVANAGMSFWVRVRSPRFETAVDDLFLPIKEEKKSASRSNPVWHDRKVRAAQL